MKTSCGGSSAKSSPAGYKAMEEWILAERKKDNDTAYYLEAQRVVERWTGVKRREI